MYTTWFMTLICLTRIEQDDDIESALLQTADVMEEMGDISQDTITEADAESLNDSMLTLLQVLDAVVDAM